MLMLKLSFFFNLNSYLTESTVSIVKTFHRERSYALAHLHLHEDCRTFLRL
jgi:hypothetical protein